MSSSINAGPKHSRIPRYQDMKQVSGPALGKGPWELLANLKQQVVIHHREELTDSRGGRWEDLWSANWEGSPSQPRITVNLCIFDGLKTDFENSHWSSCHEGRFFQWSETHNWNLAFLLTVSGPGNRPGIYDPSEELIAIKPTLFAPKKPINPWSPGWCGVLRRKTRYNSYNSRYNSQFACYTPINFWFCGCDHKTEL